MEKEGLRMRDRGQKGRREEEGKIVVRRRAKEEGRNFGTKRKAKGSRKEGVIE